jgi:hypothetical protein
MPHKHRREEKASSSSSHYDKAKLTIREAYNKPSNNNPDDLKTNFHFNLYEADRQERINEIADDEDGDLIIERQPQPITSEKTSRIIEANDRRHDAVIFGDKTVEGRLLIQ